MKTRAFWGLGVILAICAALAGCSSPQAKSAKASGPPPAVPVGVATVKQGDFTVYLNGLGSVQAFNTVSLKTRIDGQIMQVNFQEGQDVKKGETADRRLIRGPMRWPWRRRRPTCRMTKPN